jgi:PTS system nitrogen regulatory IIA component
MDLTVRDVAKLLKVSEKTVYRWIEKEDLPAYRLHEQYRLNRVELQEWAAAHRVKLPPEIYAGREPERPSLATAIERGGVHRGVGGKTRDEVLQAITTLPGIPASVDRELLYQLLRTRETLSSTGFGGGIAVPHPRNPLVLGIAEPIVLVCFLARPVDFDAVDRRPVRVLFLLLTPSVPSHLRLLSELAHCLHDAEVRKLVDAAAADDLLLARVRAIEAELSKASRRGSRS